jgi:chromate transport protein ChrA
MTRLIITRIVVTLVGIAVWGYGQRTEQPQVRIVGMAILAVALLMRFAPKRWFGDDQP